MVWRRRLSEVHACIDIDVDDRPALIRMIDSEGITCCNLGCGTFTLPQQINQKTLRPMHTHILTHPNTHTQTNPFSALF